MHIAETAAKLPRSLDEANDGLARVSSATSLAIVEVAHLSASMDRTTASLGRLLDEAQKDATSSREERTRILADVSAITSSASALLGRIEESSRAWNERSRELSDQEARADLAAAFEASVVESLLAKLDAALDETGYPEVVICGGVAANTLLRRRAAEVVGDRARLTIPPLELCTDNAAMIAAAGRHARRHEADVDPSLGWEA